MSVAVPVSRWLVRSEIVLLTFIYAYFVITDRVPLIAFALIALIWLARWRTTGSLTRRTCLDLPIGLLLLWLPVSLWVSTDWWQSLPKVYGVILGVAFFYAVVNNISTRRDLGWAAFWLVLVCAGIALAGLVGTDWAQGKIVSAGFIYDRLPRFVQGIPRSIAGGFARNGVGGTLTLIAPLLAGLLFARTSVLGAETDGHLLAPAAEERTRKPTRSVSEYAAHYFPTILAVALVLALGTLALTQSRGGILGTAIGLLTLFVWRDRRFAWILVAGAAMLGGVVLFGQGAAVAEFLLRMDARSGTLASRLEVWQRGVLMVQDFPFTGVGIGTFNQIAHALYPFFIAAPDEVVAHAHNDLLQVAVDLGIPGLIAFVSLLTGFVICLIRAYRAAPDRGVRALIAGLGAGMLAHQTFGLTDAFVLGTKPGVLIWVYFALAAVVYQGLPFGSRSTRRDIILNESTPFWKTTWFRVTLGTIVSLIFLYLALRDVPLVDVAEALARANYAWVVLAMLMMVLQSLLRTIRWMRLFYPLHKGLDLWQMFGIVLIAQMLNIVAPWRLGDLARVVLAGELAKRSKAQTLATLGTEKVFDTTMMLALLLGIPVFVTLPSNLEGPRQGFIFLSVALFAVAVALIVLGDWLLSVLRQIQIPAWRHFLDTHGAQALGSLEVLKRWDLHLELQALSLVIYGLGVVVNYLTLLALNLQLPFITSFLLLAVLLVGGFVPSSPGKVGVFQYLCIATLALFAVDQSIGLAYGILLYVVAYGTPIVLGILVLWWGGVSLKTIRSAQVEPEAMR